MFKPPGDCPVCGTFVPKGRKACQDCGADEKSGWKEEGTYDGLDLPDDEFDYESLLQEEFSSGPSKKKQLPLHWKITAIVLILALLAGWGAWSVVSNW